MPGVSNWETIERFCTARQPNNGALKIQYSAEQIGHEFTDAVIVDNSSLFYRYYSTAFVRYCKKLQTHVGALSVQEHSNIIQHEASNIAQLIAEDLRNITQYCNENCSLFYVFDGHHPKAKRATFLKRRMARSKAWKKVQDLVIQGEYDKAEWLVENRTVTPRAMQLAVLRELEILKSDSEFSSTNFARFAIIVAPFEADSQIANISKQFDRNRTLVVTNDNDGMAYAPFYRFYGMKPIGRGRTIKIPVVDNNHVAQTFGFNNYWKLTIFACFNSNDYVNFQEVGRAPVSEIVKVLNEQNFSANPGLNELQNVLEAVHIQLGITCSSRSFHLALYFFLCPIVAKKINGSIVIDHMNQPVDPKLSEFLDSAQGCLTSESANVLENLIEINRNSQDDLELLTVQKEVKQLQLEQELGNARHLQSVKNLVAVGKKVKVTKCTLHHRNEEAQGYVVQSVEDPKLSKKRRLSVSKQTSPINLPLEDHEKLEEATDQYYAGQVRSKKEIVVKKEDLTTPRGFVLQNRGRHGISTFTVTLFPRILAALYQDHYDQFESEKQLLNSAKIIAAIWSIQVQNLSEARFLADKMLDDWINSLASIEESNVNGLLASLTYDTSDTCKIFLDALMATQRPKETNFGAKRRHSKLFTQEDVDYDYGLTDIEETGSSGSYAEYLTKSFLRCRAKYVASDSLLANAHYTPHLAKTLSNSMATEYLVNLVTKIEMLQEKFFKSKLKDFVEQHPQLKTILSIKELVSREKPAAISPIVDGKITLQHLPLNVQNFVQYLHEFRMSLLGGLLDNGDPTLSLLANHVEAVRKLTPSDNGNEWLRAGIVKYVCEMARHLNQAPFPQSKMSDQFLDFNDVDIWNFVQKLEFQKYMPVLCEYVAQLNDLENRVKERHLNVSNRNLKGWLKSSIDIETITSCRQSLHNWRKKFLAHFPSSLAVQEARYIHQSSIHWQNRVKSAIEFVFCLTHKMVCIKGEFVLKKSRSLMVGLCKRRMVPRGSYPFRLRLDSALRTNGIMLQIMFNSTNKRKTPKYSGHNAKFNSLCIPNLNRNVNRSNLLAKLPKLSNGQLNKEAIKIVGCDAGRRVILASAAAKLSELENDEDDAGFTRIEWDFFSITKSNINHLSHWNDFKKRTTKEFGSFANVDWSAIQTHAKSKARESNRSIIQKEILGDPLEIRYSGHYFFQKMLAHRQRQIRRKGDYYRTMRYVTSTIDTQSFGLLNAIKNSCDPDTTDIVLCIGKPTFRVFSSYHLRFIQSFVRQIRARKQIDGVPRIHLCSVNEPYSSQICPMCFKMMSAGQRKIRCLHCRNCEQNPLRPFASGMRHRDLHVAAPNMAFICRGYLMEDRRPFVYLSKKQKKEALGLIPF